MSKGSTETRCAPQFIHRVSNYIRIVNRKVAINSRANYFNAKGRRASFRKVNLEVSYTQVTELLGCLFQEGSVSDIRCVSSIESSCV